MASKSNVVAPAAEAEVPALTRTEQMLAIATQVGEASKTADEAVGGFNSNLHRLVSSVIGFAPSASEIEAIAAAYAKGRARSDWTDKSTAKLGREIKRACKIGEHGWTSLCRDFRELTAQANDRGSKLAKAMYGSSAWTLTIKAATDAAALGFIPNRDGLVALYPSQDRGGAEKALAKISAIVSACRALAGGKDGESDSVDPRGPAYATRWEDLAARMTAQVEALAKICETSPETRKAELAEAFRRVKSDPTTYKALDLPAAAPVAAADIAF